VIAATGLSTPEPVVQWKKSGVLRNVREMPRQLDDPTDKRLASLLAADGRSTLKNLAEATGLSVSAVQARVRRLEADGVIRGYQADVDPEALGLPMAAIIAITPRDPEHEYEIPDRLRELNEIESCHSVAGDDSFVLFVRVGSPLELEELIREIRRRTDVSTRTTVVLQTLFERKARPASRPTET
jgi:Lrp/AsnC family transcriptional regulator, leucine-responsive regulatory protein